MTKPHPEPLRLRDDPEIPEDFAAALRLEETVGPTDDEVGSLAQALGISLVPVAIGAAAKVAAVKAAATSVAPAALAPAAGVGTAVWFGGGAVVLVTVAISAAVWSKAVEPRDASEPATTSERAMAREAPARTPAREVEPEAIEELDEVEAPLVESAPAPAIRARHRASRRAEPAPPPPPVEAAPSTENRIAAEAALIDRAEAALPRDPAAALRLANEHRAQFGAGLLAEEREVIAIDALMRLRQRDAAEARAQAFERGHRRSVHARRIRQLLESSSP